MTKLDRLREEFSVHKQIFFAAWAIIVALIGWSATRFDTTGNWLLVASVFAILILVVIAEYQRRRMNQLLQDIEDA